MDPVKDVSEQIAFEIEQDDGGHAADDQLRSGFPVYYAEEDTPPGLLIKEYPDGRKVLVRGYGEFEQVVHAA
jgi:hypothetical protein